MKKTGENIIIGDLFNPVWIAIVLAAIAIFTALSDNMHSSFYILLIVLPISIYAIYAYIDYNIGYSSSLDWSVIFPKSIFTICGGLLVIITAFNSYAILNFSAAYGGLALGIYNIGNNEYVTMIQQGANSVISSFVQVNYLTPVIIVPLLIRKRRIDLALVLLSLIILSLATNLSGTRVLFIDCLVVSSIILLFKVRLNLKNFLLFFIIVGVSVASLSFLQSKRAGSQDLGTGFKILQNYYKNSLKQGESIVANDITRQPLYWTTRSLFSIPVISKLAGTQAVYEGIFGEVPIKKRRDDFEYVKSLGGDPRYNTLGIYGYSYLDAGLWSMFIILLSYIIISLLYRGFRSGNTVSLLIFPSFYALFSDQLRTNSIYSVRAPVFMLLALFIFLVSRFLNIRDQEIKSINARSKNGDQK